MPRTPDRQPGVSDEEATVYEDTATAASSEGEVRYNAGAFSLYDNEGEFDPRNVPNETIINIIMQGIVVDGGDVVTDGPEVVFDGPTS